MSTTKKIQGDYTIQNLTNPNFDPADIHNSSKNPQLHATTFITSTFTIDGDVKVLGDTILEDVIQTAIFDPILKINTHTDEDTGDELIDSIPPTFPPEDPGPSGTKLPLAGLEINRGLEQIINPPQTPRRINVQIRYNDSSASGIPNDPLDKGFWEASDDGINYYKLDAVSNYRLELDLDPHLGGDLIVNNFAIRGQENLGNGDLGNVVIVADQDIILEANVNSTGTGNVKINDSLLLELQQNNEPYTTGYNTLFAKNVGSGGTGLYVTNDIKSEELVSRSKAIVFGLIF